MQFRPRMIFSLRHFRLSTLRNDGASFIKEFSRINLFIYSYGRNHSAKPVCTCSNTYVYLYINSNMYRPYAYAGIYFEGEERG